MLAAVITAKGFREALKNIERVPKAVDLIEWRLDYLAGLDLGSLKNTIKICRKPLIITLRKISEGGYFEGNEIERVEILKRAIDYGAEYVDIEHSTKKALLDEIIKNKKNAKIIISCHNFKETPDNLVHVYRDLKRMNCDFIKIAAYANSAADNFKVFDLLKTAAKEKKKIIAFCMGEYGQFSRVLCAILGSQIAYSSLEKGRESASGQLAVEEMADIYRIKKLNINTKIAGLIGNPVGHSWSHAIHNAAFDRMGVNAVYLKFKVDKLKEFLEYFKSMNLLGFSVTIPYKIEVMAHLDDVDKKARQIGAVNTVAVRNKKLIGYNTDCDGALNALKAKTGLKDKKVAVIGAGGSARAIAYGLAHEKADVTVLNRSKERAGQIAKDFNCNYRGLDELKNIDYDILINATPVGMHPGADKSIISPDLIKKNSIVMDIVFNPYKTKLLREAEKRGCIAIPGAEMLISQALLQFALWTGRNAPEGIMREKMKECLKNAGNKN